ncbi:hypothetical protein D3C71_2211250 [compost metagenome]
MAMRGNCRNKVCVPPGRRVLARECMRGGWQGPGAPPILTADDAVWLELML